MPSKVGEADQFDSSVWFPCFLRPTPRSCKSAHIIQRSIPDELCWVGRWSRARWVARLFRASTYILYFSNLAQVGDRLRVYTVPL